MSVNSKLTAIADAIREKTGESGTLTLDAMAAAIEELGVSGDLITGTITPSGSSENKQAIINLSDYGYVFDSAKGYPQMRFFFETGKSLNDTTHGNYRHIACMEIAENFDKPISSDTSCSCFSIYTTYRSSSRKVEHAVVPDMWDASAYATGTGFDSAMRGHSDGTISFSIYGAMGLLSGRTYIWGVVQ